MGACMYRSTCHRNTLDRGRAHLTQKLENTRQDPLQGKKIDIGGSPAVGGKLRGVVAFEENKETFDRLWSA